MNTYERDELARELYISDYPDSPRESALSVWDYHLEQGGLPAHLKHYVAMAGAVLSAGYRKPRTITTAEELDALPVDSVVRSAGGVTWEKGSYPEDEEFPFWLSPGEQHPSPSRAVGLPAMILWEPCA